MGRKQCVPEGELVQFYSLRCWVNKVGSGRGTPQIVQLTE